MSRRKTTAQLIADGHPEHLYNSDGLLIGIIGHNHSRRDLLEILRSDESFSWEWEDQVPRVTDDDRETLSLEACRAILEDWAPGYFRKADPAVPSEVDGDFGAETYWPAEAADAGALPYMQRRI